MPADLVLLRTTEKNGEAQEGIYFGISFEKEKIV